MSGVFNRVLFAGPDMKAQGGIASIASSYDEILGGIAYLPTTSRHGKVAGVLRFALSLLSLPVYRMRGYTVLHAHGAVKGSFPRKTLLLACARLLGMTTVHHIHSGNIRKYCRQIGFGKARRILSRNDAVVALSAEWARFFEEELGLRNVRVVHNVVRPVRTAPVNDFRQPVRLLFLGAVYEDKGIFDLLEVVARNREAYRGRLLLHIGGSGPEETRMHRFIAEHNIGDMVLTHGWATGADKERLLAECDVLVLPSYAEGMPVCILEAMTANMSVIATDVGGIPELISDHRNGILIPPGDKEALSCAISEILDNPGFLEASAAANMGDVAAYLPESIVRELEELYNSI